MNHSKLVTFGELMLRWSIPQGLRWEQAFPGKIDAQFGGAEATVASVYQSLGGSARFVTSLPENPLGAVVRQVLRGMEVELHESMSARSERIGQYFLEPGTAARSSQVLYDRSGSAFACALPEDYDWESVFGGAGQLMLSAISPSVSEVACECSLRITREAASRGIPIVLDMNYRSKLWGWHSSLSSLDLARKVLPDFAQVAETLFCGERELMEILDLPSAGDPSFYEVVSSRFPKLSWIISPVRSGGRYRAVAFDLQKQRRLQTNEAGFDTSSAVDRLGTGDAFAGAWLIARDRSMEPQKALEFALAAGFLAHSTYGDFPLLRLDEIESLLACRGQSFEGRVER